MKHTLKRVLAMGTALVLTLGLSTAALAAEGEELPVSPAPAAEQTIAVQLDGQNLTFTDAVPQVKDQRTFLPFRAVFEAMGAEVSNEGDVITAARDGKTLTMTIGSTEATLTEGETATAITMDVAPYVDSATWRTYVPVRFAAQAFGCAVGWDQDDQTAVIVDAEKLLGSAKAGKEYTILAKYLEYSRQFNEGAWAVTADFDADLSMMGMGPATVDGTLEGVVADAVKAQMSMNMKLDLEELMADLSAPAAAGTSEEPAAPTAEEQALLTALKEKGVGLEMRMDMDKGMLYMTFTGEALEALGLPADTWYSMDMSAIYEDMGLDYGALMEMTTGDVDYTALLSLLLSTVEPNDKDTAYSELTQAVDLAAQLLRDDAWAVSGNDRILHYALEQDGVAADFTFTLTMRGDDVSAYDLSVELSADVDGSAPMSISLQESMDADGRMEASMQCDAAGLMDLEFSMSGRYTEGKTAPETEPPKGAVVVELTAPEAPADPVPTSGDPAEVVIDKIYTTGGGFIGVTEG